MTGKSRSLSKKYRSQRQTGRSFEEEIRKANRDILKNRVITDTTQTDVGDATVRDTIVKHSSFPSSTAQGPTEVDASPVIGTGSDIENSHIVGADRRIVLDCRDDSTSVPIVLNNIGDGGKMSFVDRSIETPSDLVALIHEAVSGTPSLLLSDVLPTMLAPETMPAPHVRSATALLPITPASSLVQSATPPTSKYLAEPPSTFRGGRSVAVTSSLFGMCAHEPGNDLLRFLKNALASIWSAKPANPGNRTMRTPPHWSGRPMAYARYERPHGRGGFGANSEMEKRSHFPVS